jgi:hypothetical protein
VLFDLMHSKRETGAEQSADLRLRVAPNREPTAASGTFWPECRKDEMTPRPEGSPKHAEIALAVVSFREEVEDRSVVPDRERTGGSKAGDVGLDPGDTSGRVAEASAGVVKSACGDVENAEVRVACTEQMIDEG